MSAVPGLASSSMSPLDPGTRLKQRRARILRERAIESVLFLAALVSVFTTVGIVYVLVKESVVFFTHVSLWDFLTDTQWTPLFDDAHFGIMVLLSGTLTSSFVALAIAIPLGTIIAIYLSEFAPFSVREVAKPFLELLGGVPTIVYGYFALLFVTPLLQAIYLRNDKEIHALLDRPDGWLKELTGREEPDALIRQAYLRTLSRLPEEAELARCRQHLAAAKDRAAGLRDLLWALLNTQEFITNH